MQVVLYRIILFLVLLYKNNGKEYNNGYGNDECPCDQSQSSCLVLIYLDGDELKRVEKCAELLQVETICHDYKSKISNVISCTLQYPYNDILPVIETTTKVIESNLDFNNFETVYNSSEDSPNVIGVETFTAGIINLVKRDIPNTYQQIENTFDGISISESEEPKITDPNESPEPSSSTPVETYFTENDPTDSADGETISTPATTDTITDEIGSAEDSEDDDIGSAEDTGPDEIGSAEDTAPDEIGSAEDNTTTTDASDTVPDEIDSAEDSEDELASAEDTAPDEIASAEDNTTTTDASDTVPDKIDSAEDSEDELASAEDTAPDEIGSAEDNTTTTHASDTVPDEIDSAEDSADDEIGSAEDSEDELASAEDPAPDEIGSAEDNTTTTDASDTVSDEIDSAEDAAPDEIDSAEDTEDDEISSGSSSSTESIPIITPTQPDLITTVSTTVEGSVTRTPRPAPSSGYKVNFTISNALFLVIAFLWLKLSSGYFNVD